MLLTINQMVLKRPGTPSFTLKIHEFSVAAGELVAITGPSGSGKSTALDLIGMVMKPTECALFEFAPEGQTRDIAGLWGSENRDAMARMRRDAMGYVLQTGELLSYLTARENVELTLSLRGKNPLAPESQAEIKLFFEALGLKHQTGLYPYELSVGQRQRVAIARALVGSPALILADEPMAALDPPMARSVMALFVELVKKTGAAMIMVSHDPDLVHEFGLREAQLCVTEEEGGAVATLYSISKKNPRELEMAVKKLAGINAQTAPASVPPVSGAQSESITEAAGKEQGTTGNGEGE